MNKKSIYRNQMFLSLLDLLLKNKAEWEKIPLMALLVEELQKRVNDIRETAKIAGVSLASVTGSKNYTMDSLTTLLFEISSALAVFASRTNNIEMHEKVDFPESHLENIRQSELVDLAEVILGFVNANLDVLADYGITKEMAEEFNSIIEQLKQALPAVHVSQAERKSANEKLGDLISSTLNFLSTQMDKMMISLRRKSPDFYSAYTNTRDVTIYGIRHEKNGDTTAAETKPAATVAS